MVRRVDATIRIDGYGPGKTAEATIVASVDLPRLILEMIRGDVPIDESVDTLRAATPARVAAQEYRAMRGRPRRSLFASLVAAPVI